ncbi:DUF3313 family protein [Cellvibrio sp. KY-YJ-3]|jgi:hypothetical protein|uniref:DUF3313 family protein n=1 Tax=Cellvibrio sp. KY-YJ-3 TaxID=454662 RepID=UPI001248E475|nr:DUF3313 family protein [Cellvibrio sp. KY-YJ-3]QEY14451.1 DUF3313 family protein [Cellvibrio sp. KY-YJ-3]
MKRLMKNLSVKLVLIALATGVIGGCSMTKPHEKDAALKADQAGLSAVEDSRFDGTFVAPNAQFAQYSKLLVEQLDLSEVKIRKQSTDKINDTPWELSDADRRYYQERYTEALMTNLIVDGRFATSLQTGADVLQVKAKVLEIAPLASKDDSKGRPTMMKVYSEGMGTMTLELTLVDSVSGDVLAIITDRRDLGRIWEENNRVTNNVQIRLAFNQWLRNLRTELDRLAAK